MNDVKQKYIDAAKLVIDGEGQHSVFVDPLTIMMIASILGAIFNGIRLWCQLRANRKNAENIQGQAQSNSLLTQFFVRREVIKVMGRKNYRNNGGSEIVSKIIKAGATASVELIQQLMVGDESELPNVQNNELTPA
jgi:ABC-type bacteriocin/lantibiotic exporter with double-glycine peptidase domain